MPTMTNRWLRWACFGAALGLLLCLLSQPSIVQPASVEQVSTEDELVLFSWPPEKCAIYYTVDKADFDVDSITGEQYRRITNIRIDCPEARGASFDFADKGNSKRITSWSSKQGRFNIPILISRVTEAGFSWNFTPEHVDVKPGSVSNPSLLISGGDATGGASQATGSFTPTGNALMLVAWSTRSSGSVFTISNSHSGSGAWNTVSSNEAGTGSSIVRHGHFWSTVGASPGVGTVTNTFSVQNDIRSSWVVAEVIGHHTTTPVSEFNTGGGTGQTALSIAIAGFAAGNKVISSIGIAGEASVTFGAGETELADATSGGSGQVATQMQYSNDTTHNWSWGGESRTALGVVVEYAQAAGEPLATQIIFID